MQQMRRAVTREQIPELLAAGGYFAGIKGFPHFDSPICRITQKDKFEAIREVVERCQVFSEIVNKEGFIDAVCQRERLQSTGIGHGVAIAHGKFEGVGRVSVGLGICHEGICFDAVDNQPVHLLFVIASHPDRQNEYLKTLSWLMRFLKNATLRRALVCPCLSLIDPEGSCRAFVERLRSHHFSS
ncbi:PTS sugar transporter subunit IIA [Sediminispirochaeta bajacaliforniensis]|uniref:PTS sugar transporter subunit IIA n=1 Tax=Sediminispirochaeta bajacaliforniensis TaxID=148 RepID=UPI001FE1A601|nr:PTS sugar transporter subunit IIA [Sediminispirochaeta bajacaliforniensis]